MMDILMSETCWAHKKWNTRASDIKLVFYSSIISTTITATATVTSTAVAGDATTTTASGTKIVLLVFVITTVDNVGWLTIFGVGRVKGRHSVTSHLTWPPDQDSPLLFYNAAIQFQKYVGWWMKLTTCWRCSSPDVRLSFTYFSNSPIVTLRLNLWDGESFSSTEVSFISGSRLATSPRLPIKHVNQWKHFLQQNTLSITEGL